MAFITQILSKYFLTEKASNGMVKKKKKILLPIYLPTENTGKEMSKKIFHQTHDQKGQRWHFNEDWGWGRSGNVAMENKVNSHPWLWLFLTVWWTSWTGAQSPYQLPSCVSSCMTGAKTLNYTAFPRLPFNKRSANDIDRLKIRKEKVR